VEGQTRTLVPGSPSAIVMCDGTQNDSTGTVSVYNHRANLLMAGANGEENLLAMRTNRPG
jgi:hypothetical protein